MRIMHFTSPDQGYGQKASAAQLEDLSFRVNSSQVECDIGNSDRCTAHTSILYLSAANSTDSPYALDGQHYSLE